MPPIDPNGSKPERMDIPGKEFHAQNYTANEVEHLGGKPNNWRPKKKVGLPDQKAAQAAYRKNYDAIDWSARLEIVDGNFVAVPAAPKDEP